MDQPIKQKQTSRERLADLMTIARLRFTCAAHALFDLTSADTEQQMQQDLLAELGNALGSMRAARSAYREATDPDLIEALIFEMKSAEAKYNLLLKKAKDVGLTQTRAARHR